MARKGLTLVEMIVVLAIMALLLAVLLPAIHRARTGASKAANSNNLRQIILGIHNYSTAHQSYLPSLDGNVKSSNPGHSAFVAVLPFLEQENLYRQILERNVTSPSNWNVRVFLNPLDPSIQPESPGTFTFGHTSYALNAFVFDGNPSMTRTFPDGTSSTISIAEHYSTCNYAHYLFFSTEPSFPIIPNMQRPTFADGGQVGGGNNCGDYFPTTSGQPPMSVGSKSAYTFQSAPRMTDCEPRLANSPDASGMTVAMADGSVRRLSLSIAPTVYWGSVTPAAGEPID